MSPPQYSPWTSASIAFELSPMHFMNFLRVSHGSGLVNMLAMFSVVGVVVIVSRASFLGFPVLCLHQFCSCFLFFVVISKHGIFARE